MSEKTIPMAKGVQIRETAGLARVGEWVRFSVPFGRGELLSHRSLCLTAPDGKSLPCQCRPLKLWPDGSVKWLIVDAAVDVTAGASSTFIVRETDGAASPGSQVRMERRSQELAVDTGAALFTVDTGTFRPFASVWRNGAQCSGVGGTVLTDASGNAVTAAVERVEVEDDGPLHAVVRLSGRFRGRGFAPSFSARLHFFAGSARATVEFTLHNPRAARHRGGLWDLGDPGSYLFRSLALEIPFSGGGESGTVCYAEQGAAVTSTSDSLAIYQESSGGATG